LQQIGSSDDLPALLQHRRIVGFEYLASRTGLPPFQATTITGADHFKDLQHPQLCQFAHYSPTD